MRSGLCSPGPRYLPFRRRRRRRRATGGIKLGDGDGEGESQYGLVPSPAQKRAAALNKAGAYMAWPWHDMSAVRGSN